MSEKIHNFNEKNVSSPNCITGWLRVGTKAISGVAIIASDVNKVDGSLSHSWTFHVWQGGYDDTDDLGSTYYAKHTYSARPLIKFSGFDGFEDAAADIALTIDALHPNSAQASKPMTQTG